MFIRLGTSSRQNGYVNRFILNLVMSASEGESEKAKITLATNPTTLVSNALSYFKRPKRSKSAHVIYNFLCLKTHQIFFYLVLQLEYPSKVLAVPRLTVFKTWQRPLKGQHCTTKVIA